MSPQQTKEDQYLYRLDQIRLDLIKLDQIRLYKNRIDFTGLDHKELLHALYVAKKLNEPDGPTNQPPFALQELHCTGAQILIIITITG